MCPGDERELFLFQYNHFVMALEVLMHEVSVYQEELGCIMDEAMECRF